MFLMNTNTKALLPGSRRDTSLPNPSSVIQTALDLWNSECYSWLCSQSHVPKDVSDRDPLRDWDRDLNYVCSHASQMPSQSRTGSAHCEVIFYSCAVRANWPMHGFSAHFQNAHARITFRKSFAFTCPRIRLSRCGSWSKTPLFFAF